MDYSNPATEKAKAEASGSVSRKPRILVAACGSVGALDFGKICSSFTGWAEVRAVVTESSIQFIAEQAFPDGVPVYFDQHDWNNWKKIGDNVLHIQLCQWADVLVIAPLSANTLGKIGQGLCDNLLTCIVRAWDYKKRFFVAPSMNSTMWKNPSTERFCVIIEDLGVTLIRPESRKTDSGEFEHGIMADPSTICSIVRHYFEGNMQH